MKHLAFYNFILILTVAWLQFYAEVRQTFNGVSDLKAELRHAQESLEQAQLQFALQKEEFIEFRQNVATLMPDVLRSKGVGEEGYAIRSLASTITRSDAEKLRGTIAKTLFEQGKAHFRKNEFTRAIRAFDQVIQRYGYSTYVVESYFLKSESHFQQGQLEDCTDVINQMIELFPSHELTGLAMIRLGRVFEAQKRNEEAIDIYRTVLRSFPQRDVAGQAKASLRGLDL